MFKHDEEDLMVMARTVWGEARGESEDGQLAVAYIILNRARNFKGRKGMFGNGTIKSVCFAYKQFSCWNKDDPNYNKILKLDQSDKEYSAIKKICFNVLLGKLHDITRGSTHYYAKSMKKEPYWAKNIEDDDKIAIGNHFFMQVY